MKQAPVVVGLGEILWDVFPDGARFGGAPANFACSAAGLGHNMEVAVVSAVGDDELGERAIAALVEHEVDVSAIARNSRPTGQVLVELDAIGHASYRFEPDAAWDRLEWSKEHESLAQRVDAVCFGTLGQRSPLSLQTIRSFVAATRPTALRIFDINLRPPFYSDKIILDSLELANVLKLNDDELANVAKLLDISGTVMELLRQIQTRFTLDVVALTRGADGALIIGQDEVSEVKGVPTKVVDTVGAGDAFTAVLTIGLLQGVDLQAINQLACEVAAFVCSQSGATPKLPARFGSFPISKLGDK